MNVWVPGAPHVIVKSSSMVRCSPFATAGAVADAVVGETVDLWGAVAARERLTSTGADGP